MIKLQSEEKKEFAWIKIPWHLSIHVLICFAQPDWLSAEWNESDVRQVSNESLLFFRCHFFFSLVFIQLVVKWLESQRISKEINCQTNWIWCESCELNTYYMRTKCAQPLRSRRERYIYISIFWSYKLNKASANGNNTFYLCSRAHKMCLNYDALV